VAAFERRIAGFVIGESSCRNRQIVWRRFVDGTPVWDLPDEFGLQPTQIDAWQKQLAANAMMAVRVSASVNRKARVTDLDR